MKPYALYTIVLLLAGIAVVVTGLGHFGGGRDAVLQWLGAVLIVVALVRGSERS